MAFTIHSQPLYSALNFLAILLLLIFFCPSLATPSGYATTYDLIHRDSPLSPFYNPSSTQLDRLHDAFQRSLQRVNHLKSATQSPMNPGGGEYLMKMSLGAPPIEIIGIVDTGSHLTWTQCLPCIECYNQTIPLFNPSHSSSYNNISCGSTFCRALQDPFCDDKTLACEYEFSYGDGSHTSGILASETLTLGTNSSLSLPNFAFGCAHNTHGIFDNSGSGIIGLSTSNLSLISQLGHSFGQKFSYCLVPNSINSTSKITFGNDSVVSGPGTVTTPFQKNMASLYYLTLEAISVGTQKIDFPRSPVEGNIAIDSGTTLTLIPSYVFKDLVLALDKLISLEKVDDPIGVLSNCYKSSVGENENKIKLPQITMHFKGGADVKLKPVNTFSRVKHDVVCFTMNPNDQLVIYGNLAQANFEIGYDLEAGTVSFKPTDCAK